MPNKKTWKLKNTTFLIISLFIFFYFADTPVIRNFIAHIGSLGYFGAILVGMFFVSTFTVAPSVVVLFYLGTLYGPLPVALLAGAGAMLGDFLIFKFFKDKVFDELRPIFSKIGGNYLNRLFTTPYFAWFLPVVGAAIIASPLPDELGVGILGLSKLKSWQFLLVSYLLNSIGIFFVLAIARQF